MHLSDQLQSELTDALARGRLTIAELAALQPTELDAIAALASEYLDVDRCDEAASLFAGLVTLNPFTAHYWRGYGIALHRRLELRGALAAYDAALLLEPDNLRIACYRAEIYLYLGELDRARSALEKLQTTAPQPLVQRVSQLLAAAEALLARASDTPPPATESAAAQLATPNPTRPPADKELTLTDGRTLPLAESRYADLPLAEQGSSEKTLITFAPAIAKLSEEPTAPADPTSQSEVTNTAIVMRRRRTPLGRERLAEEPTR